MNIIKAKTLNDFYSIAAWKIAAQIIQKPDSVIGLATGRTTGSIHKALAAIFDAHPFDTSRVTFFGMDEITGVDREYFGSCYYMLLHEVVLPLHVPMENYIMPPTRSDDFAREGENFIRAIRDRGPVDLQVLGIGENGHIGFNQPGTPFNSTVFLGRMEETLETRIRRESNTPDDVDLGGLTIGIQDAMHSRRILLVANGSNKTAIIKRAVEGPVTIDCPASILQLHPFCDVVVDPEAAADLTQR